MKAGVFYEKCLAQLSPQQTVAFGQGVGSDLSVGKLSFHFKARNATQYKPKNFHQKEPTVPQMIALTNAITKPILNISGRST